MRHKNIYHLSERAVTIEWEPVIDKEIHREIMSFDQELKKKPIEGWIENVPSYHSLTVYYDPLVAVANPLPVIASRLNDFIPSHAFVSRKFKVPVCYDAAFATDLPMVSERLGIPQEEIIRLHAANTYTVFMIGFMPGFPYMGTLDPKLFLERKATPSRAIPAGSVAIAGLQTGIYPFESPGGWYVIGRTPWTLFQQGSSTFEPGDEIEFVPIGLQEMKESENRMKHGH